MKTIKTLSSAMVMASAISGAWALDADTQAFKDLCDQNSSMIWDSKNNDCINIRTCTDDGDTIHCNRVFEEIQTGNLETAQSIIQMYVDKNYSSSCTFSKSTNFERPYAPGTDDYIGCVLSDGTFISFAFDDITDDGTFENLSKAPLMAACITYGYDTTNTPVSFGCADVPNKAKCLEIEATLKKHTTFDKTLRYSESDQDCFYY